jgi:membrane protein required for colicin V production
MADFVLGLFLAGLLVRGWARGFVREILDLVGLVAGLWVAFLLSAPMGEFLTDRFGVSPEVASISAGVVLFVLFGIGMGIAANYLSKVMSLPGLNLANRIGGAGVAALWGIAIVLLVVNLSRVLPFGWSESLEESSVAQAIAGEDALPQQVFEGLGSRGILSPLAAIQDLFGTGRAVPEGDEALELPPAAADEIRQVRDEATRVLEAVNEHRAERGLSALGGAAGLVEIAERRASEMYQAGRISRDHPPGSTAADYAAESGLRLARVGENLALASSWRAAFDAIADSPTGLAHLDFPDYDRAGVSVLDGPTGSLVVIVFGG